MADPQVVVINRTSSAGDSNGNNDDIEMGAGGQEGSSGGRGADASLIEAPTGEAQAEADELVDEMSMQEPKLTFLDYLSSPVVELGIGEEGSAVTLTAHQALLTRSPYFAQALAQFSEDVTSRRIDMPSEDVDAMVCFLQYLYTGEYSPKKLPSGRLELDSIDSDDGAQLLKHGRVYTLSEKLEMQELSELALAKIGIVQSTAKGEIEYARYVYGNTAKEDRRIRRPIASFWGSRSHILRHEADPEFQQLCMEFPEFAFDVLTQVLDSKERRGEKDRDSEVTKSGRKRQRQI